jgi:hypothetical protein
VTVRLVECAVDGREPRHGRPDGDGRHGTAVARLLAAARRRWCWYGAVDRAGAWAPLDALDAVAADLRPGDAVLVELQADQDRPFDVYEPVAERIDALVRRGATVFLPAGNGGVHLACRASAAIRVGALDPWGKPDERSCHGPGVDRWAPGTLDDGLSGTSRAAVLALLADHATRADKRRARARAHGTVRAR